MAIAFPWSGTLLFGLKILRTRSKCVVPVVRRFIQSGKPQRPPGGGRPLVDTSKVYDYNNWDNVVWDEEQEEEALRKVEENSATLLDAQLQEKYEAGADKFWDDFYTQHQNRFFKDRNWLFTEFPELAPLGVVPKHIPQKVTEEQSSGQPQTEADSSTSAPQNELKNENLAEMNSETRVDKADVAATVNETVTVAGSPDDIHRRQEGELTGTDVGSTSASFPGQHASTRILEVGCGVGNTVFPVLQTNNDPGTFVYCCDLSETAVQLVKEHPDYSQGRCHAFVCDVTKEECAVSFPDGSLDIIILIFVLSAINPDKMQTTINRLSRFLKPGGLMVFRDYGRYDLAQLRFKKGRCLAKNFYVRGDGTRVYFFTQADMKELFTKAGLVEEQNLIDRRLQVNRGRQIKMYRVWIQCKYRNQPSVK